MFLETAKTAGSKREGNAMATDTASQGQVHQAEVVIIGCGPVGAMLANLLGLQGVSTLVIEREATIYNLPRAVHFDDEVMRLVQTVGLAETVQPLVHLSPGMKFVDDTGRLLLDWSRPLERGPQGWYAGRRCRSSCGPKSLPWSRSRTRWWSAMRTSQPAAW